MSENSRSTRHPGVGEEAPMTRSHWLARATACALCCLLASISPSWAELDQALPEDADLDLAVTEDERPEPAVAVDEDFHLPMTG